MEIYKDVKPFQRKLWKILLFRAWEETSYWLSHWQAWAEVEGTFVNEEVTFNIRSCPIFKQIFMVSRWYFCKWTAFPGFWIRNYFFGSLTPFGEYLSVKFIFQLWLCFLCTSMEIFHDSSSFSLACSDRCCEHPCHSDVKVCPGSMAKNVSPRPEQCFRVIQEFSCCSYWRLFLNSSRTSSCK